MNEKIRFMLLKTVQDDNILPVTSICDLTCRFCSHRGNPPGLEVYSFGHLDFDFIKELVSYLSPDDPVIIGESATRIIEGEPFIHPDIRAILTLIRSQFPAKLIKITTNGSHLTDEMLSFLKQIDPVELNISLNCANPEERVFLMNDKRPDQVFSVLNLLHDKEIKFNGSIVAMPHLLGWDSVEKTFSLLAKFNPETVRVYLPGFSRFSPSEIKFAPDQLYQKLRNLIDRLAGEYSFPLLLEPPLLKDLVCAIKGIIVNSPAEEMGLQRNDIILAVNDREVISRVDGFNQLTAAKNPELTIKRGKKTMTIYLVKKAGERPGIVVDYDLEPATIFRLRQLLSTTIAARIALITSVLGSEIIKTLGSNLQKLFPEKEIDTLTVKNNFFGGSIMSAGLLVNQDVYQHFQQNVNKKYDLIILPGIIYDIFGNDLTGENKEVLKKKLGIVLKII